jgi:hypothetical protein
MTKSLSPNRIAILVISLASIISMQGAEEDCMVMFKQAYQKMIALYERKGNKGVSVIYKVEAITKDDKLNTDVVEMKIYNKKSKIVSQKIMIYQDEQTIVAIQPSGKSIFISRPLPESARQSQMENVFKLQDSLSQHLILKSCTKDVLKKGDKETKKLTFQISPSKQEKFGITGLNYWINQKEVRVVKILIEYAASKPLKTSSYTIEHFDGDYKGPPFDGSAVSVVMTSNNKLKQEYKGYSVVDKR